MAGNEENEDMLTVDGHDNAIIGVMRRFGQGDIFVYDEAKVIENLIQMGMTEGEAIEFFEFNIIGAWMGEGTPGFVTPMLEGEQ